MDTPQQAAERVRCVACRTVYDHAAEAHEPSDRAACPECGGTAWLALRVPIGETAQPPAP